MYQNHNTEATRAHTRLGLHTNRPNPSRQHPVDGLLNANSLTADTSRTSIAWHTLATPTALPATNIAAFEPAYLSVPVFSRLRSRHLNNLARFALNHHVAVLTQSGALLGVGLRGAGISLRKLIILVFSLRHGLTRAWRDCRRNVSSARAKPPEPLEAFP